MISQSAAPLDRPQPSFGFLDLQNSLTGSTPEEGGALAEVRPEDPILGRIVQILHHAAQSRPPQRNDLLALLRHALIARSTPNYPARLRVNRHRLGAETDDLHRFGLHAVSVGEDWLLEALPWRPEWLVPSGFPDGDVFAEVFAGQMIRRPADCPMDPCVAEVTGYDTYVCPGQREAVRSLLFMPQGSTLIVNLPTGSGKTLVGQVPTLLSGPSGNLTLFVVPTKALAIDQARRMRDLLAHRVPADQIPEMAWHSRLSADVRSQIKRRVRTGTQGILFTSPEAVAGALLPALFDAAARGFLKHFVIDETHMVAEWGDGFRPDFQILAGIRRGLLRQCKGEAFRTVLMSATLSPQTIATLKALFGPPETVQMVSAVHLRPEPRYWAHRAPSWPMKVERVLDVIRHAPRPFILYVTRPGQAEEWLGLLRGEGYARVSCFHGKTDDHQRERIIEDWAQDRLDGIVATSAFGVGMDKAEVKTIIHATVPESLDRFYQEVGRGGRDGRASLSVVITTERDEGEARALSRPKLIGEENAYDRWKAMFDAGSPANEEGLRFVDISARPPHVRQETDYNVDWNMRTLILMARTGLVELDALPPLRLDQAEGESDEAFEARQQKIWQSFYSKVTLRTLDPLHRSQEHFEARTAEARRRSAEAASDSFGKVLAAIQGRKEMGSVLAALYRNTDPGQMVVVSQACRGCPADQSASLLDYQIPVGQGIKRVTEADLTLWHDRFPWLGTSSVILFKRGTPLLERRLEQALRALVGQIGIREVSAPRTAWQALGWLRTIHRSAPAHVLAAGALEDDALHTLTLPLTRATLMWPWDDNPIPDEILLLDRPFHVILVPDDIRDTHPLRRFADTAAHAIALDTFLDVATQ